MDQVAVLAYCIKLSFKTRRHLGECGRGLEVSLHFNAGGATGVISDIIRKGKGGSYAKAMLEGLLRCSEMSWRELVCRMPRITSCLCQSAMRHTTKNMAMSAHALFLYENDGWIPIDPYSLPVQNGAPSHQYLPSASQRGTWRAWLIGFGCRYERKNLILCNGRNLVPCKPVKRSVAFAG